VDTNEVNPYEPPEADEKTIVCILCRKSSMDGKPRKRVCPSCLRDLTYTAVILLLSILFGLLGWFLFSIRPNIEIRTIEIP